MSRKAPPELRYTDEEIDSLLSSCQSTSDSWIIVTYPNPLNELASLETQLKKSLPEAKDKAIFLMPLRFPDGHVAGMVSKKTADAGIKLFYFDPINDPVLSDAAAEDLRLVVQNVFPGKNVEFTNVRFRVGDLGAEDSAAVLVQSLIDVARVLEKKELANRSQLVSEAKITRFYSENDRDGSEINATKEKHYEQEKGKGGEKRAADADDLEAVYVVKRSKGEILLSSGVKVSTTNIAAGIHPHS